jgi:hypothetical protein
MGSREGMSINRSHEHNLWTETSNPQAARSHRRDIERCRCAAASAAHQHETASNRRDKDRKEKETVTENEQGSTRQARAQEILSVISLPARHSHVRSSWAISSESVVMASASWELKM